MTPDQFRKALKELGLTQSEFAGAVGVNRSAIVKWLVGGNIPRYAVIILQLMRRFELTIEDIEQA